MGTHRVLVVDDEPAIVLAITSFLEAHGLEVLSADTLARAEELLRSAPPDVVVLDCQLPDGSSVDRLPALGAIVPDLPIVILTGHGTIDLAVRALKDGAEQFLTKPVALPALLATLERAIGNRRNRQRHLAARLTASQRAVDPFLGTSAPIRRLAEQARRVAAAEAPVLILGETGSGKGVLAAWLHEHGPRAEEPFVDLNCAGLSRDFLETELFGHGKGAFTGAASSKPGLLEVANRGTVFLDEIGDMDPAVQPKVLKVLEDRRYRRLGEVQDRHADVRLVAATHRDLGRLVAEERFRADLYFRIAAIPLTVPPLRDRREDIPALAEQLIAGMTRETGRGFSLSPAAHERLQAHDWPGNVRELRNVLERAVLLGQGPVLSADDLLFDAGTRVGPAAAEGLTLLQAERGAIEAALRASDGRVAIAAERLGVPRSTLYQKLKQHGLRGSRS